MEILQNLAIYWAIGVVIWVIYYAVNGTDDDE